jgi:WD repeat-containing protein 55
LTSSLDGKIAVFDLRKNNDSEKKNYSISDCMEEDLTNIAIVKNEKFVACSTSEANILLFKWNEFGDYKDNITGHPNSIETMVKKIKKKKLNKRGKKILF